MILDDTTDIAIWSQTEQGLAISAGSLATLQPLLRIALDKIGSSRNSKTGPASGTIRTFGQGSRKSSTSRRTPRSVFSLSTFTRMDDNEHTTTGMPTHDRRDPELPPRSDTRTSFRKDGVDYRVSVQANHGRKWASPIPNSESQEELQEGITKKISYRVI